MNLGAKLSAIMAAMLVTASVSANNTLDPVVESSKEINQSAASSQVKIDKITDDIQSKVQKFKMVNKEIDGLKVYNGQLEKQINNQLAELNELDTSIDKVSVIERQVTPLMIRMIDGLAQFVSLDVPFLPEERAKRINDLKALMDQANVEVSEKFRRVMEAYQVEVDYGNTIEAYTGILALNGSERDVDFLRIGRVALIYQTRDGSKAGIWDQNTRSWSELSQEHRIEITKGLQMARKQAAPSMLKLPVPSPK